MTVLPENEKKNHFMVEIVLLWKTIRSHPASNWTVSESATLRVKCNIVIIYILKVQHICFRSVSGYNLDNICYLDMTVG